MRYCAQKSRRSELDEGGFGLVELVVGMTVFTIIALSFLGLFISLVRSSVIAKQKAVASALATNQMEYLKSLPYDSLAVAGGPIYATNPLPASSMTKVNGTTYKTTTSINYADDAYDGCGSYPTQALKQIYCRNYPSPTGAPTTDTNPADYKSVHVTISGPGGGTLAQVDTQIAAKVSETASTTGALFVKVIDSAGNPISTATVSVSNNTVTPNVNVSDSTDNNGIAIFYGLPPDSGYDYVITSSKSGYSSLTTIAPSGTLQPTYPNQKILTQQSSFVTLTIKPQGIKSLLLETVDTSGAVVSGAKVYVKGGYKKYTATSDTSYYFDNMSPTDTRPTTDAGGLASLSNLVPGTYFICGDTGATSCSVSGATRYLAAAVPYVAGTAPSLSPVSVPTYDPSNPPTTTFTYGTDQYLSKVRLILTTSSSFPRISTLTPGQADLSSDPISNFPFSITGANLPCTGSATNCGTTVKFTSGSSSYTASCTGNGTGAQLSCTVNLSGISTGVAAMSITSGGNTLTLPGGSMAGGLVVVP